MQRAMILASGPSIEARHLVLPKVQGEAPVATLMASPVAASVAPSAPVGARDAEPTDIRSLERRHILDTLAAAHGVRRAAAGTLGMSERTLRHKLQQYRREGYPVPAVGGGDDSSD
jgi:two-component system, response regulator FlrC